MRLDGRLQVLHECGDNIGRHRTCPSHSQETVLPRAGPISKFRVAKTDLGTSTRVVLRRGNLKRVDLALICSRAPISGTGNAPDQLIARAAASYGRFGPLARKRQALVTTCEVVAARCVVSMMLPSIQRTEDL